jgi:hypothetical protein
LAWMMAARAAIAQNNPGLFAGVGDE